MSPREVFEAAMAAPPITEHEIMQARCAKARVAAEDERKRAPTPQLPLEAAA